MSRSQRSSCIDPYSVRYYHGRITREEAEKRLHKAGCMQGLYLLRESAGKEGSYALSLCFEGKIYHYAIERQHGDGMVAIKDGKRFVGPVELGKHYESQEDGLLCRLREPCMLRSGEEARSYSGMSHQGMEEEIIKVAKKQGMSVSITFFNFLCCLMCRLRCKKKCLCPTCWGIWRDIHVVILTRYVCFKCLFCYFRIILMTSISRYPRNQIVGDTM